VVAVVLVVLVVVVVVVVVPTVVVPVVLVIAVLPVVVVVVMVPTVVIATAVVVVVVVVRLVDGASHTHCGEGHDCPILWHQIKYAGSLHQALASQFSFLAHLPPGFGLVVVANVVLMVVVLDVAMTLLDVVVAEDVVEEAVSFLRHSYASWTLRMSPLDKCFLFPTKFIAE